MFNFFGAIPDMLMGRKPIDALTGNALGVAAATAAAPMMGSGGLLGAPGAMGAPPAIGAAAPAAAPTGLFGSAMEYAKPIGQAMQVGMQAKGLLGQSQQMGPSPMAPPQAPNNTLGSLASQGQQSVDQQLMQAAQERAQRRKMFGGFNARSS
jgi:hypothetical protein